MTEDGTPAGPLRRRAAGVDRSLGIVLLASLALLLAGLFLPAITIRSMFLAQDYSLIDSVLAFLRGGDWFLFAVIFVFTIAFPVFKVLAGLSLWFVLDAGRPGAVRMLEWLSALSKWSMLDVFIIAVIVLMADGRLLSSAEVQVGAILFAAAVLTSTWATRRLSRLAGRTASQARLSA